MRILVEARVRVVPPAVRQLPVVHVVLAAPVPPHDTHEYQQQQQERERQHHTYEPAGSRHLVVAEDHRPVWER